MRKHAASSHSSHSQRRAQYLSFQGRWCMLLLPGRGSLLLLGEIKTINLVLACTGAGDCFAVQYVLGSLAPAVAGVAPMIAVSLQQLHWCRGPLVSRRHDLGTMHGPRRGTIAQCAIQMQRYGDTEYKPDGSDHSTTCPRSSEHPAYYVIVSSFPCPPASPSIPSPICIKVSIFLFPPLE